MVLKMIINAAILEDNILFANQLKNLILIWADKNSHNFNIDVIQQKIFFQAIRNILIMM